MPYPRPARPSIRGNSAHPPKTCAACGRGIAWRKKWERDWESVKFCSDACRARRPSGKAGRQDQAQDQALEQAILRLLGERGRDKTICPSEAARSVASKTSASATPEPGIWQPLMEPARAAARRLVASGEILITQNGHTIDPSTVKGPIRLKLR